MPKGVYERQSGLVHRIDVQDIVGQTFGVRKVVKYIGPRYGLRSDGYKYVVHEYECCCMKCGNVSVMHRGNLINKATNLNSCVKCRTRNEIEVAATINASVAKRQKANRSNHSTGVRHYSISYQSRINMYMHRIEVDAKGKRYLVKYQHTKDNDKLDNFVELATEVNKVLFNEGYEGFIQWYNDNVKWGGK